MTATLAWSNSDCAECHSEIYRRQIATRHAQTLRPFQGSPLASLLASASFTEAGAYRFEYSGNTVTVRRGVERATASLDWAFGAGALGWTALGRADDIYFEHRVSFFARPGKPGITPGQPLAAPRSPSEALGVRKFPDDAFACLNCHSTGLERDDFGEPDVSRMIPGIQCERCHGLAQRHIDAARSKRPAAEIRAAVFNGGRLPPKASIEVCGGCHRVPKPGDLSLTPEQDDPVTVRFQPIGLLASRCFRTSGRMTCMTCHDPHADAARNDAALYSRKCIGCHEKGGATPIACKRAQRENCLPCHMRQATPYPHLTFTDHRIRIY